jgi:RecJ-like exonuclease
MAHCFVLKRSIVGTYFTIHGEDKPTVLAFTNKNNARYMVKHVVESLSTDGKKQQKIVIEQVKRDWLLERCALNCLNVNIYEDNMTYTSVDIPNDDYVFNLENSYRYY